MNSAQRLANTAYVAFLAYQERSVPFWSPEKIEARQRQRLRSTISHAYETVPYYRRVMDEMDLRPRDFRTVADLEKLPLLDDVILRRDPDQFASSSFGEASRRVYYTSGAHSHAPKKVYWDHASEMRKLAYAERDRAVLCRLIGRNWGHHQLYILPQASAVFKKRSFWESRAFVPRGLARRLFLSPDLPFEEITEQIAAHKPDVVFSYGSYADLFFRFLETRGVPTTLPRVWMYGSDMLSQPGRELIERKFGCMVSSTYQAVETSRIGFQCERRRGFHLNIDLNAVRVVGKCGQPISPGETGEVVVSNLFNRATVLLNYRLGDRAALASRPCECGRSLPLLERLEGRCSETIRLPNGRTFHADLMEIEFRKELDGALQSQLMQVGPASIVWRIVPFPDVDGGALQQRLAEKSRSILGDEIDVSVELVASIPRASGGKHVRVIPHTDG